MTTMDPPRWPGAPPHCPVANLPRFDTLKAAKDNLESLGGHLTTLATWECRECGGWHLYPGSGVKGTSGDEFADALKLPARMEAIIKRTSVPVAFEKF